MNEYELTRGDSFVRETSRTYTLKHRETSQIKYDLIGKVAEGTILTRRTVSAILQGIRADKLYMFKNNPEEFITKIIRLINEQKATMIVEHISYDTIEGEYDSTIFTAEKNTQSCDKAFLAKKAIQDYVFTDGSAEKSIERKFAEDLDAAEEVCVYAKLPRTFQIPTPMGNYSPDWAIAFYEGKVKHIFFVAETKGTMESLELRPIEQAKISCAKKLFNEMSTSKVKYHDVDRLYPLHLCKYRRSAHNPILCLRKYFPVHFVHKLTADVKPQAAARYVSGVCASEKAVENVCKVCVREGAAAVADSYENTAVLLGTINCNFFSVAVFDGVFHDILYDLDTSVRVAAKQAVGVAGYRKMRTDK